MKSLRNNLGVVYSWVLYMFIALLFSACTAKATPKLSATPIPTMVDLSPTPIVQAPTATVMDLSPTPTNQPPAPTTEVPPPTPTTQATPTLPEPTAQPTLVENTATHLPTPQPTETPSQPTIGSTRVVEIDQMVQVYVPAGEFIMGAAASDKDAKQTIAGGRAYPEIPQHTVYLDGYWIDKYEVTNSQYALCVAAGVCQMPWVNSSYTYDKYYGNPEFANHPVIWVNWFKARDYCTWAGRRLPSEAEWEKAARGTDGRMYPWGNEPVDGTRANFCDVNCTRSIANTGYNDGYPDTAPVGSYPAGASPYGAMDMSGNVWEWVNSLIMPYPYDANDGREDPNSPDERAWRGGPWSNGYWWMRSSVRYRSVSWYQWYVLGFRCASTP